MITDLYAWGEDIEASAIDRSIHLQHQLLCTKRSVVHIETRGMEEDFQPSKHSSKAQRPSFGTIPAADYQDLDDTIGEESNSDGDSERDHDDDESRKVSAGVGTTMNRLVHDHDGTDSYQSFAEMVDKVPDGKASSNPNVTGRTQVAPPSPEQSALAANDASTSKAGEAAGRKGRRRRKRQIDSNRPKTYRGGELQFPWMLHQLLEDSARNNFEHIISWNPCGQMFKVHDRAAFVEQLLPRYVRQSKYKSFARSLNLWGFTTCRKCCGENRRGAYFHPLFVRGHPSLGHKMDRIKIKFQHSRKCAYCKHIETHGIERVLSQPTPTPATRALPSAVMTEIRSPAGVQAAANIGGDQFDALMRPSQLIAGQPFPAMAGPRFEASEVPDRNADLMPLPLHEHPNANAFLFEGNLVHPTFLQDRATDNLGLLCGNDGPIVSAPSRMGNDINENQRSSFRSQTDVVFDPMAPLSMPTLTFPQFTSQLPHPHAQSQQQQPAQSAFSFQGASTGMSTASTNTSAVATAASNRATSGQAFTGNRLSFTEGSHELGSDWIDKLLNLMGTD